MGRDQLARAAARPRQMSDAHPTRCEVRATSSRCRRRETSVYNPARRRCRGPRRTRGRFPRSSFCASSSSRAYSHRALPHRGSEQRYVGFPAILPTPLCPAPSRSAALTPTRAACVARRHRLGRVTVLRGDRRLRISEVHAQYRMAPAGYRSCDSRLPDGTCDSDSRRNRRILSAWAGAAAIQSPHMRYHNNPHRSHTCCCSFRIWQLFRRGWQVPLTVGKTRCTVHERPSICDSSRHRGRSVRS